MRPNALTAHLPREKEGARTCYFPVVQISLCQKVTVPGTMTTFVHLQRAGEAAPGAGQGFPTAVGTHAASSNA